MLGPDYSRTRRRAQYLMKYTGTVTPATRNAATPQAVAWRLPCLFACANTPVEIAAARAMAIRNEMGSAAVTGRTIREQATRSRYGASMTSADNRPLEPRIELAVDL